MTCHECYERYEKKIGTIFGKYGSFVSNYPVWILTICIAVNCLLGIGLIRIESETDVETLYTPMNSRASQDRATVKDLFPDLANFYTKSLSDLGSYGEIIIQSKNGQNILVTEYFNEIEDIYNSILASVNFTDNGQTYTYNDVCALRNNNCVVTGTIVLTSSFQQMAISNNITYPTFGTELISSTFGNSTVSNGLLTSATMMKLRYNLRQNTTQNVELSRKWESGFITYMQSLQRNMTDLAYASSDSLNSELDKNTQGDIVYFSLTFTLMITYASLATIGGDCVSDRSHIGRAGVLATVLAILGSFGLVSACGVKFVNIVGVMPFLIIGIGLDDMFILMSGLADASHLKEDIKEKIRQMMMSSGVAITITSITDYLAFGIGASSPFLSVRNFCIYTGIAVVFCYLNQLTFTTPCLVIHERRSNEKRSCATCRPIRPRTELKAENKSKCFVFCCGGTPATQRSDTENPMEKYPVMMISRLVLFTPMKICILILFAVYLGFSIWGTINLEQGLDLSNLVSDDSYYHKYSEIDRDHFTTEVLVSFVISSEYQYSASLTQSKISDMLSGAQSDSDIYSPFEINWLSSFKNSGLYDASSETNFINNLKTFLTFSSNFENDIAFDETQTKIKSCRFYVISNNLKSSFSQGNFMQNMRSIADSSGLSAFAYAPSFIFFEQYVQILPNTLQTLGVAVGAMLLVTTIFMPHPFIIVLVTFTLVTICVGIFGFMHFWGLTLSSVTMIHIIMSVGFSVDFSAHICHAFLTVEGTDRNAKVAAAITRSGGPIFNAAVSSVIGILMLLLSRSYIFQSFFKLMFLVIVFGLAHAMLLLPVLLSIFGPMSRHITGENHRQMSSLSNCGLSNRVCACNDEVSGSVKNVEDTSGSSVANHQQQNFGSLNRILVVSERKKQSDHINSSSVSLPVRSNEHWVFYDKNGYRILDPLFLDGARYNNVDQFININQISAKIKLTKSPTTIYDGTDYTELPEWK